MKLLCVLAVVGSLLVPPAQANKVRRPCTANLACAPGVPEEGGRAAAPARPLGAARAVPRWGSALSGLGCRPLGRGGLRGPPLDLKRTRWSSSQGPVFGHVV